MKISTLVILPTLLGPSIFAQNQPYKYDTALHNLYKIEGNDSVIVELPGLRHDIHYTPIPPVFVGDKEKFIKENMKYPEVARKNGIEGYADVYFSVDSNGKPQNVLIMFSTSEIFDNEAARLVRMMRWEWDKNEKVKAYSEKLRISFKL